MFLLQRLYAWGTICAMYSKRSAGAADRCGTGSPGGENKLSSYVQWVLSKGQRVQGVKAEVNGRHDLCDLVDRMTGAKRTEDEEAHDFFGALYEMSSWNQLPLVPMPTDLLR